MTISELRRLKAGDYVEYTGIPDAKITRSEKRHATKEHYKFFTQGRHYRIKKTSVGRFINTNLIVRFEPLAGKHHYFVTV